MIPFRDPVRDSFDPLQDPATDFAVVPTGFGANFDAAFDAIRATDLLGSEAANMREQLGLRAEAYQRLGGDPQNLNLKKNRNRLDHGAIDAAIMALRAEKEKEGWAEDDLALLAPRADLAERAKQAALEKVDRAEDVARGATFTGDLGALTGGFAGFMTDPVNVLLGVASGGTSTGLGLTAGIARTMAREALAGAAIEAVQQPTVQDYRSRLGLPSGPLEAAMNIATGAAGGAVLGGVIEGGTRGVRALNDRRLAKRLRAEAGHDPVNRAASDILEREADIADTNPALVRDEVSLGDHEARLQEVMDDVAAGRVPLDRVARQITEDEIQLPMPEQIARAADRVDDVLKRTLDENDPKAFGEVLVVSPREKAAVNRQLGAAGEKPIDDGDIWLHTIQASEVRHWLKEHGDGAAEVRRGNLPISRDHLLLLPRAIEETQPVYRGQSAFNKQPIFERRLELDDGTLFIMEEVRTGRRRLAFKTAYLKPHKSGGKGAPERHRSGGTSGSPAGPRPKRPGGLGENTPSAENVNKGTPGGSGSEPSLAPVKRPERPGGFGEDTPPPTNVNDPAALARDLMERDDIDAIEEMVDARVAEILAEDPDFIITYEDGTQVRAADLMAEADEADRIAGEMRSCAAPKNSRGTEVPF